MTIRNVPYAGQTAPQMVELDQSIADLGALGIVPCTAAGTNIITLTPNANTPTISSYANYLQFSFVAVNTTTGNVTLQVGSLAALPVYAANGTTQLGSGAIVLNQFYVAAFNQALNSGVGGWEVVNSNSATGVTAGTFNTVTVDVTGRVTATAALRSYLAGMQLSTDSSSPGRSVNVSTGNATDSTNATSIVLSNVMNKIIGGAWAAGAGSGALGTGVALRSSVTYHVVSIINNGAADWYLDTVSSAVNTPASTTSFRRVGSIITNNASTSGQISVTPFSQFGDEFILKTAAADASSVTLNSGAGTLITLTVPTGVQVGATFRAELVGGASAGAIIFTSPDENDQAVTGSTVDLFEQANGSATAGSFRRRTNPSAQIRWSANVTVGNFSLGTYGWFDRRGQDT